MAVGAGKDRVTVTLPAGLLAELQREAKTARRTVSDVILAEIQLARESVDQREDALKDQLTHLSGRIEEIYAFMHQLVVGLEQVVSKEVGAPVQLPLDDGPPPIVTTEQMYGPITPEHASEAPQRVIDTPPRKRWSWRG